MNSPRGLQSHFGQSHLARISTRQLLQCVSAIEKHVKKTGMNTLGVFFCVLLVYIDGVQ